jgi:hypothetical protein
MKARLQVVQNGESLTYKSKTVNRLRAWGTVLRLDNVQSSTFRLLSTKVRKLKLGL